MTPQNRRKKTHTHTNTHIHENKDQNKQFANRIQTEHVHSKSVMVTTNKQWKNKEQKRENWNTFLKGPIIVCIGYIVKPTWQSNGDKE
jgi:hypothetical protein